MANIAVRNEKQIAPMLDVEPVQMIRDLLRWNPFRELAPIVHTLPVTGFVPTFEVRESPDRFLFLADLPGIVEKDIEITLAGNRLIIAGVRKIENVEENETYFTNERMYGAFTRSFTLPEGVDLEHIVAEL